MFARRSMYILFVGFSLFFLNSCKKNEDKKETQSNTILAQRSMGRIVLPSGSTINPNGLTVISPINQFNVKSNSYQLDTASVVDFSTQFVVNAADEPILMHYDYPNLSNGDISSESTALAILMNFPSIQSLTNDGKQQLINKINSEVSFKEVVQEIDKMLVQGRSFATSTDTTFHNKVSRMFSKAATLRETSLLESPILVGQQDRNITLLNNGVACIYVAGLYKDNQLLGSPITIDAKEIFPTSLPGLFSAVYNIVNPSPAYTAKNLKLEGDGVFTIRIRSGRTNPSSIESQMALTENRKKYWYSALTSFLLTFPVGQKCIDAMKAKFGEVLSLYNTPPPSNSSDQAVWLDYYLAPLHIAMSSLTDVIDGCAGASANDKAAANKFLKALSAYFKIVDIVNKIGTGANMTMQIYHFLNAASQIDTCFKALGTNVKSCFSIPGLSTAAPTSITSSSAISGGNISDDGGAPITVRGVVWSTSPNPILANNPNVTNNGTGIGSFTSNITNLTADTIYHLRAYATNSVGTAYGNEVNFKTGKSSNNMAGSWKGYYTADSWNPNTGVGCPPEQYYYSGGDWEGIPRCTAPMVLNLTENNGNVAGTAKMWDWSGNVTGNRNSNGTYNLSFYGYNVTVTPGGIGSKISGVFPGDSTHATITFELIKLK
jgi:hypothetical protein